MAQPKIAETPVTIASALALRKDKREEFIEKLAGFSKLDKAFKTAEKKLEESHKSNGKFLFALKVEYIEMRANGSLPASKTFAKFYHDVVGGDANNKAQSCANTIAGYIESKLIAETDYDDNSNEAIMRASAIFTKSDDKIDHPAVKETAELLKRRPSDILKKLKAILDRFTVQKAADGETEETVFLSPEELYAKENAISPMDACKMAGDLAQKGHWGSMMATLLAMAQTVSDPQDAESLFREACKFGEAFRANVDENKKRRFTDATLNKWRKAASGAPVMVTEETEREEYFAALERAGQLEAKYGEAKITAWTAGTETPEGRTKCDKNQSPAAAAILVP